MMDFVRNTLARVTAPVRQLGNRSLDTGISAYQRGEFAAALEILLPLALANTGLAQFAVSEIYAKGNADVAPDLACSLAWLERAVEENCIFAMVRLADRYAAGDGVGQDPARARVLHLRAAEQGNARAQFALASLFEQGLGGAADADQALRWYRLAAHQDHIPAIDRLVAAHEMPRN